MKAKIEFKLGLKLDNGSFETCIFETEEAREQFIQAAHHVPEIIAYHSYESELAPQPNLGNTLLN